MQSVMNGTYPAPTLILQDFCPLEARIMSEIAAVASRYLQSAKLSTYVVLDLMYVSQDMTSAEYDKLVGKVNLSIALQFLGRQSLLDVQAISVTGATDMRQYYAVAVGILLSFAYCLVFIPTACELKRFVRQRRGAARDCYLGLALHIVPICALFASPVLMWSVIRWLLLALLLSSFALLLCALARDELTSCSMAIGGSFFLASISGCILPRELLPQLVSWLGSKTPMGISFPLLFAERAPILVWLIWVLIMLGASMLLWRRDSRCA